MRGRTSLGRASAPWLDGNEVEGVEGGDWLWWVSRGTVYTFISILVIRLGRRDARLTAPGLTALTPHSRTSVSHAALTRQAAGGDGREGRGAWACELRLCLLLVSKV